MHENCNQIMKPIRLSDLKCGLPGISPIEGANLYENCMVAVHNSGHTIPVTIRVNGQRSEAFSIGWDDLYCEQLKRTYRDEQSVTERAAAGVSVMLALQETCYTIIKRSRKGTGFDYLLGDKDDPMFTPKARLEISGIMKENVNESLLRQFGLSTSNMRRVTGHVALL